MHVPCPCFDERAEGQLKGLCKPDPSGRLSCKRTKRGLNPLRLEDPGAAQLEPARRQQDRLEPAVLGGRPEDVGRGCPDVGLSPRASRCQSPMSAWATPPIRKHPTTTPS